MSVLTENEKGKVLKKYSIDESQLPLMFVSDPAAVALSAEPGNIIEIKRTGETGDYISYRIVK
jgi:DNA-directed RNA polymerase subunit H (RpoH/RPB5)